MVLDKATTRYVSLMMTYSCNLNCTYCYEQFKSSHTMSVAMAKQQIAQVFDETIKQGKYEALELSFMGGEPLLEFEKLNCCQNGVGSKNREYLTSCSHQPMGHCSIRK